MARTPTPWYWEERQEWCVNLNGDRHKLGEHPQGYPAPRKAKGKWNAPKPITDRFDELKVEVRQQAKRGGVVKAEALTVIEVYDKFLEWCRQNREAATFDYYEKHITGFLDKLPNAVMPATELKPFHVVEWVDGHLDWGDSYRRQAYIAVQRPMNWAEELGYITTSPIKRIKKPAAKTRDNAVSEADFTQILTHYKVGDPFRDLVGFLWETGCRPQEAKTIEPRHILLEKKLVAFPPEEAKGKKKWRIIRLTEKAVEILTRRLQEGVELVFTNEDGKPWTNYALCCRFTRLQKKLGTKYACYDLRHGFAQRMLEAGNDHLTVAELLGHQNGQMLSKVYSHMNKADQHLRDALNKGNA
jgi:integrase